MFLKSLKQNREIQEKGQAKGPFSEFVESEGIVTQYTMPGIPQQNGVAEKGIIF